MSNFATTFPGRLHRSRADWLSALLPVVIGLSVAQLGTIASGLSAGQNPGITLADGGATDVPEPSCVGCHFETPGEEGAPGSTGQAEAAHKKFAVAAGLREAGTAIRTGLR